MIKFLNILLISHVPLDKNLGAGRVHFELKKYYENLGHHVEKYDINDAFPEARTRTEELFGSKFTEKVYSFLLKNAYRFDVIDANMTNIVYPKSAFNFSGVVLARSHGITPFYEIFSEKSDFILKEKKTFSIPNFIKKNINLRWLKKYVWSQIIKTNKVNFYKSVHYADIIHCLNTDELGFFLTYGYHSKILSYIPNSLSSQDIDELNKISKTAKQKNKVSFIGTWGNRKGSMDWNTIVNELKKYNDSILVDLLGTSFTTDYVLKYFSHNNLRNVKIVPKFANEALPSLLASTKVFIFPSYMEGFGFAVLESIAAGIPVVAYSVPGVRDILGKVDSSLLIRAGDVYSLVQKVIAILTLPDEEYNNLSIKCQEIASEYDIKNVGNQFLELYRSALN